MGVTDEVVLGDLLLVPVRHHSPACAFALRTLLEDVRPRAVLLEGPRDLNGLLPHLEDLRTRPPVAAFCQAGGDEVRRACFFPFSDHSPEWVGLREGRRVGAEVTFVDLPFTHRAWTRAEAAEGRIASLLEESHLFHSRYVTELAARSGCRDGNELWERLFELRTREQLRDWRTFFREVAAYCRMARQGYTQEALEAEGNLDRERAMAEALRAWQGRGPAVVVTGGFHTSALKDLLAAEAGPPTAVGEVGKVWLLRSSFEQLDALQGYASGMPSPGFHQRVWEGLLGDTPDFRERLVVDCLTDLARACRAKGLPDAPSTAGVQAAALQARRLADLRGHAGPGREDLLDAVRSCFMKGEEAGSAFLGEVLRHLGGHRLGELPPDTGAPPLVEEARRRAAACGVRLGDTVRRTSRLDLYRSRRHRARRHFFHLTSYLGLPLARWQGGPDFLNGTSLDLLFETWDHAWSPMVEARLVELSPEGATLEEVASARLRKDEEALGAVGQARSSAAVVQLALRACLLGLQDRLPQLLARVEAHLEEDGSFDSVVRCAHHLLALWRAREPLGATGHPRIQHLLHRAWDTALFLLPTLRDLKEEDGGPMVDRLLALRALGRLEGLDPQPFHQGLGALAEDPHCAPGIGGSCAALLFLEGPWDEARLADFLEGRFGPGAEPTVAVRCLAGLMAAGPELLWRVEGLLGRLDAQLQRWDEEDFLRFLPDLRQAFTRLNPRETARVARRLAGLHGVAEGCLEVSTQGLTQEELLAGTRLNLDLARLLGAEGLGHWGEGHP